MLAEIEGEVTYTSRLIGKSKLDPRVMAAIGKVSREAFVSPDLIRYAYDNGPLPIGHGQTISQPYIVALMTDLLQLEPDYIVLEVGTGSGYQSAVLSQLVKKVFTIERIQALGDSSAARLKSMGYSNIEFCPGKQSLNDVGMHQQPHHEDCNQSRDQAHAWPVQRIRKHQLDHAAQY